MIYEDLTAAHFLEWGRDVEGADPSEIEEIARKSLAFAARGNDGALVAIGGVRWCEGRCWAWFDMRQEARSKWVHRIAREMFAALGAAGEREVWATADLSIPDAERWLARLGFEPCGGVWRLGLDSLGVVDRGHAALGRGATATG